MFLSAPPYKSRGFRWAYTVAVQFQKKHIFELRVTNRALTLTPKHLVTPLRSDMLHSYRGSPGKQAVSLRTWQLKQKVSRNLLKYFLASDLKLNILCGYACDFAIKILCGYACDFAILKNHIVVSFFALSKSMRWSALCKILSIL